MKMSLKFVKKTTTKFKKIRYSRIFYIQKKLFKYIINIEILLKK